MTTIFDAEISGSYAGMEPIQPREVPTEYRFRPKLAAAWLEAYDRTVTSQQNQRYGVMEAPSKAEHSGPKRPKAPVPEKPKAQARPTMRAILESRVAEHV